MESIGLSTIIDSAMIDRSGSVVLEEILRNHDETPPALTPIGLKETIVVGAWYIWWQRREFVKGESIAPPDRTTFSILALANNYVEAAAGSEPKEMGWRKPPHNSCKLNIDAWQRASAGRF